MMKIRNVFLILALSMQIAYAQKVDVYQRPVQVERSRDFDAIRYRISLIVDLEKKSLTGENLITMTPLNDGLKSCVLDAEYLLVDAVVNEEGTALSFKQQDNQVFIDLGKSYKHTDTIRFAVKYTLEKENLGLRFFDESPTNPLMASSDCFPNKAHYWIPCYDYPNDKVATEMIVTVDAKHKVLSNGRLVGITDNGQLATDNSQPTTSNSERSGDPDESRDPQPETRTWHWNQDLPHSTYLISLSIGDFEVIRDSLGSLPVNYWVYHYHAEDARRSFRKTPHMISFYNKLYGYDYPWDKYDQVISPYMGGGAEATSATLLGEGAVTDEKAEQDFSYERIIAHEIAHQWWGDLITLRSWEHTWLNESFATYSDYLYTRNEYGEDAGAYDLLGKKNQYLNEARTRYVRPIVFDRYNDPGDNFDSHTYPKGANVLHLLRYMLGDDTFIRVLSAFLHEHAFRPVDTHDLMKTVKEVSGKNMDWFFDQFIFKPGHLVVEVEKSWDPARKLLILNVMQKQDSLPGVPVYTIPVNIGFTFPGNKVVKEIWLKEKSESFEFKFDSEPIMVRFDEGNYLLKECTFKKPLKELIYQSENDDVPGRLAAVGEMKAFKGDLTVAAAWKDRITRDPFWAVRQAALVNLAGTSAKDHLDLIMRATGDENSRVRQSAVRILGDLNNPSLVRDLKRISDSDDSYAVQAEALRSIGKCGGKRDLAYITKAGKRKSHRNVVAKAAAEAQAMINLTKEK